MTLSTGKNEGEQEFLASSESGTTGRDAAHMESTYHVDLDDMVTPTKGHVKEESKVENMYDVIDQDYTDKNNEEKQRVMDLKDIRFYGAKDFSKKIKEELGKKLVIKMQLLRKY